MNNVIKISKNKSSYFFDPANKPAAYAKIGDVVSFETKDCFNDEITTNKDLTTNINMSHINPCTGPLYIEEALPGSVLVIKIERINLRKWGVLALTPNEGVLNEYVKSPFTKIVKINEKNQYIEFSENIKVSLRPHIGTIGTTPPMRIPTGRTGIHGGNMDIRYVSPGNTIYFPVFVKGALLMLGDVHANMGDGEICIGVETGAEVIIKIIDIYKNTFIPAPIIETENHWITYADAPNGKEGVKEVSKRMVEFLCRKTGISVEEATLLVSITGDISIAQWAEAGYNYTFYLKFPKDVFVNNKLKTFLPL
ncbi:MAG: acetamidase/formamidase family protein [Candidatus Micrarchaeia archaeon]